MLTNSLKVVMSRIDAIHHKTLYICSNVLAEMTNILAVVIFEHVIEAQAVKSFLVQTALGAPLCRRAPDRSLVDFGSNRGPQHPHAVIDEVQNSTLW